MREGLGVDGMTREGETKAGRPGSSSTILSVPRRDRSSVRNRKSTQARRIHTGQELAPAFAARRTGCCGVTGPFPQPLWIRCTPNYEVVSLENRLARRQDRPLGIIDLF